MGTGRKLYVLRTVTTLVAKRKAGVGIQLWSTSRIASVSQAIIVPHGEQNQKILHRFQCSGKRFMSRTGSQELTNPFLFLYREMCRLQGQLDFSAPFYARVRHQFA